MQFINSYLVHILSVLTLPPPCQGTCTHMRANTNTLSLSLAHVNMHAHTLIPNRCVEM
jgi:hypothetical protein